MKMGKAFLSALLVAVSFESTAYCRNLVVLIVGGGYPSQGALLHGKGLEPDNEQLISVFNKFGLDARISRTSTGSSIALGGEDLASEIEQLDEFVIAVGHSLGGIKILEALRVSERARAHTVGAILVNSPNWGSIVSELAAKIGEPDRRILDHHKSMTESLRSAQQTFLNAWDPLQMRRWNPWWVAYEDTWYRAAKSGNDWYLDYIKARSQILFEFVRGGDSTVIEETLPRNRTSYMQTHEHTFRKMDIPIVTVIGDGPGTLRTSHRILSLLGANDGLLLVKEQELFRGRQFGEKRFPVGHMQMVRYPYAHSEEWKSCISLLLCLVSERKDR